MNKTYNLLSIFDLDSTLIDNIDLWTRMNEKFFNDFGIPELYDPARYRSEICGLTFAEICTHNKKKYLQDNPITEEELLRFFIDNSKECYKDYKIPHETILYINCIKSRGVKVAIGTAGVSEIVDAFLEYHGYQDLFDVVVTSDSHVFTDSDIIHKNHIYKKCIELADSRAELTTIYDDSEKALLAISPHVCDLHLVDHKNGKSHCMFYTKMNKFSEIDIQRDAYIQLERHVSSFEKEHKEVLRLYDAHEEIHPHMYKVNLCGHEIPLCKFDSGILALIPGFVVRLSDNKITGVPLDKQAFGLEWLITI